jgi:thiamine-phosphate pyrophosphorylase
MTRCRLYLITPSILTSDFAETFARALDAGDVACAQLRLKGAADDDVLRAAERLMPIAQAQECAFLINDRPDLAARIGADGVHVGQSDASYADARRIVGPDAIVGITCHASRHLAMEAAEAGADYVAFGAFFPSSTKDATHSAEVDLLEWWAELMEVPCVAIGGITPENAAPLVRAGADFLAVSAGVWAHADGPAAAIKAFDALFARVADEA